MENKYIVEYQVKDSDIDELNHVNNIKYIEWIQDISTEHWYAKTKETDINQNYFWVVTNHNVDYLASALPEDELIFETFVEKFEKAYSYRRVNVKRKKDNKLLMTGLTKWCFINQQTKRVARVTQEIIDLF
jgi:acyl-CoA thioester hydrolase